MLCYVMYALQCLTPPLVCYALTAKKSTLVPELPVVYKFAGKEGDLSTEDVRG